MSDPSPTRKTNIPKATGSASAQHGPAGCDTSAPVAPPTAIASASTQVPKGDDDTIATQTGSSFDPTSTLASAASILSQDLPGSASTTPRADAAVHGSSIASQVADSPSRHGKSDMRDAFGNQHQDPPKTLRRKVTFSAESTAIPSPSSTPKSSFLQSQSSLQDSNSPSIAKNLNARHATNEAPGALPRANTIHMGDLEPGEGEDEAPQQLLGSPIRFAHEPTPLPAKTLNALEAEEDEERMRYRSWREGNPDLKPSKSARRSKSRDESRLDRKIEAILPKADAQGTHTRSRKSSQYMGLFKENEVSLENKTLDRVGAPLPDARAGQSESAPPLKCASPQNDLSTVTESPVEFQLSPTSEQKTFDALGHGGPKTREATSSFVSSPLALHKKVLLAKVAAAESVQQDGAESRETKDHAQSAASTPQSRPVTRSSDDSNTGSESTARNPSIASTFATLADEDEESEKEHISSATYIPHRQVRPDMSPLLDMARRPKVSRTQSDQVPKHMPTEAEEESDHGAQSPQEVEISLKSQGKEQLWHGEMTSPPEVASSPPEYESSQDYEGTSSASGFESLDDSAASTTEYESDEEAAVTTSPTTPKAPPPGRKPHKVREPMSAVPLKPFRHQVGGHNTVFQFSRKTICKKMNNRENVFYEVVEKYHPELLDFMPRYIGVLNVTFSKAPKRKREDITVKTVEQSQDAPVVAQTVGKTVLPIHSRVISHSQQPTSIPQVIFEHNRHIMPDNLFRLPMGSVNSVEARHQPRDVRRLSHSRPLNPIESISRDSSPRPHIKTWGSTRVNRRLQEQVLREVFAPPLIHRHRHHTRHHHLSTGELSLQPNHLPTSAGSLMTYQRSISDTQQLFPDSTFRSDDADDSTLIGAPLHLSRTAPDDEPEYLEQRPISSNESTASTTRVVRRRHSGSGLRRRAIDVVNGVRSGLEFHEEDGYGADQEDEVFTMDKDEPPVRATPSVDERSVAGGPLLQPAPDVHTQASAIGKSSTDLVPKSSDTAGTQSQADARLEMFILLEDLTARMEKPCVLDLKMGTRQYGVEADEKKQKSQQRKCQMTTSRELGVRVCGMQVWNVKTDSYLFEDKYFGRDLKAGAEFQAALTRFFFDGIGYSSARRYIPIILDQLSKLERIVRDLPGYRLYASSLLIIYDRAAEDASAENSSAPPSPPERSLVASPHKLERADSGPPLPLSATTSASSANAAVAGTGAAGADPSPRSRKLHAPCPIKIKIVDFANCVTKEDTLRLEHATIPPHDAQGVDRGYLRGLRTLKTYFGRIWAELAADEAGLPALSMQQRGRGLWTSEAWADDAGSGMAFDDPGEVSV